MVAGGCVAGRKGRNELLTDYKLVINIMNTTQLDAKLKQELKDTIGHIIDEYLAMFEIRNQDTNSANAHNVPMTNDIKPGEYDIVINNEIVLTDSPFTHLEPKKNG